jgi:hypothetical protein
MTAKNPTDEFSLLAECFYCKHKVNFEILAQVNGADRDNIDEAYIGEILAKCPDCKEVSLYQKKVIQESWTYNNFEGEENYEDEFSKEITRLYPKYINFNKSEIAHEIYSSFEEANMLYENGFFNPAMTSLRRTLENICIEKKIPKKLKLEEKLKKLMDRGFIDEKLYAWAEMLRLAGNLTTHSNEKIKEEDLQDMFYFIEALINYIFVLNRKFELYKNRHSPTPPTPTVSF